MTFEQFWNANGHGYEHGGDLYRFAKLCWDIAQLEARASAIEEAARHAKSMTTSGQSDYQAGWNAALEILVGDLDALARPVPTQEEK